MVYELPGEEREVLLALVRERMRELLPEIRRSDHREFRDYLKHEQQVLERCLEHLSGPPPGEPASPVVGPQR